MMYWFLVSLAKRDKQYVSMHFWGVYVTNVWHEDENFVGLMLYVKKLNNLLKKKFEAAFLLSVYWFI